MTTNLRRNVGLATISGAKGSNIYGGKGGLAKSWGRLMPSQGDGQVILGEVATDVLSQDSAGVAFPGGQLWVRLQSTDVAGGDGAEDTTYWVAVPSALPGAYTYNPARNVKPLASISCGTTAYPSAGSYPDFQTSYTPTAPIRTANGLYTPYAFDLGAFSANVPWGPINQNGNTIGVDLGPSWGTNPQTTNLPLSPGYRNFRCNVRWNSTVYGNAVASTTATITVDGTAQSVTKADLTFNASTGFYEKALDFTPTLPSQGHFRAVVFTQVMTNYLGGLVGNITGARLDCALSPRIDIPLPWTCTDYGGLVAPGGILTGGNVPGF